MRAIVRLSFLTALMCAPTLAAEPPSLADGCLKAPQPDEAACTRLIESAPETDTLVAAHMARGFGYAGKKRNDAAVQDFDRAVELKPGYATYLNRGVLHNVLKAHDKAIDDFTKALSFEKRAEALTNRGNSYVALGKPDVALRDFDASVELAPDNPAMVHNRANGLARLGRFAEAVEADLKVVSLAANNTRVSAIAHGGLCWNRAALGLLDEAMASCDLALQVQRSADTLNAKGVVYLKRDEPMNARRMFSAALAMSPDNAESLYALAVTDHIEGNRDKAAAGIAEARKMDPVAVGEISHYLPVPGSQKARPKK